ncbi:Gfo/Idh/MocA family oxidoreductase [Streptomyces sp. DSM 44917]|uniref:Gfo/Idh/MocA family oxidoreductase n=1 Tax=Streptomyces boetiae TaxID=3075541 RepID=A0ABU2LEE2_9ACTN|nr:Gfo/Idh/MocA family oxidoreductase [Streptomyces sp. DSM 44917]MDT0309882.1 Gfo/Idh/MocA family oxidoreductase [Streptomyces sp. DSM 44917]
MKVGLIGLGDIAHKAYLPVLTTQPGVQPHLHSRSAATLERAGLAHRVPPERLHADLDSLLAAGLDAAFVHAPAPAHPPLVARLLAAGVPTYVDTPLADGAAGARRLVELAEARGTALAVGFTRRHAPAYAQCLEHPRDLILMQRHRRGLAEDPRRLVFDSFIHVVDTLRFLAPGPVEDVTVTARVRDGLLDHVVLHLSGDGFSAVGAMSHRSGSDEEILEISGQDRKREVRNLAEIVDHKGQPSVRRRGDWVPVARQRGIEQAALSFLEAVRAGRAPSARDALRTHELCERIVREALGHG